jgi:uncharacterized protein
MKIVIDIGHPAHVHYFRNFISNMEAKGHEFLIFARDKEISLDLLEFYRIPYISRSKGRKSRWGKFCYLITTSIFILIKCYRFKPDIFLSFSSPYLVLSKIFYNKPYIVYDDTEHARFEQKVFTPFSTQIITPECFSITFPGKQIRFNGYMELAYLHPAIFKPDPGILTQLSLKPAEKFIIIRFVSWEASHDWGATGFSYAAKLELVKELSKYQRVFISSEKELPAELSSYKLNIKADRIHHLMAFAFLYIGEGATMASEACVLGIPFIYVNSLKVGYVTEQVNSGAGFQYSDASNVFSKSMELITNTDYYNSIVIKSKELISKKIDVTAFMGRIFDEFPTSLNKSSKK